MKPNVKVRKLVAAGLLASLPFHAPSLAARSDKEQSPMVDRTRRSVLLAGATSASAMPLAADVANRPRVLVLLQGFNTAGDGNDRHECVWIDLRSVILTEQEGGYYSDVIYFSYAGPGKPFGPDDTFQPIAQSVEALKQTIDQYLAEPGHADVVFDLVGHSLGGVVAWRYATQYGSQPDRSRNLSHVATLHSPLNGAQNIRTWVLTKERTPDPLFLQLIGSGVGSPMIRELGDLAQSQRAMAIGNSRAAATLEDLGIRIRAFTSTDDQVILPDDTAIEGHSWQASLGHGAIFGGCGYRETPEVKAGDAVGHNGILHSGQGLKALKEFLSLPAPNDGRGDPGGSTTPSELSATMLLIDTSGSMADPDASGTSKIDAARRAALRLNRMIANESRQGLVQNRIGLASFSSSAALLQDLTTDSMAAAAAIDRLQPDAYTNMSDGLRIVADRLADPGDVGRRTVILLSDGLPNLVVDSQFEGDPQREIRDVYIPKLQASTDCLYVVGLGDPAKNVGLWDFLTLDANIDEAFLQELAAAKPDCGGYYPAVNAGQLAASFLRSRHLSAGGTLVVNEVDKEISQGQTIPSVALDVPNGSGELNITLDWPGSQLDLSLTDPHGKPVVPGYSSAELYLDEPPAQVIVHNPVPGRWGAAVYGRDIPSGGTQYSLIGSVRAATPSGGSQGAWLVALVALAAGAWAYGMSGGSGTASGPLRGQLILHEPRGARVVPVRSAPLTIGKVAAHILIDDPHVSRRHARLRMVGTVEVIEDLGSANGTWVNGQRITQPTALRSGDRIRFGAVEGEWHD